MKEVKVFLGSDHAGFELKEKIKKYLKKKKILFTDLGPKSNASVDYPDYAFKVAKEVVKNKESKGILICGSGVGMAIAANKVKGIRAILPFNIESAKLSREHNDSNVLTLPGRFFSFNKSKKIISIWLNTDFSNEARHKRRIRKIDNYGK